MTCEKCWAEANHRALMRNDRSLVPEIYRELIATDWCKSGALGENP